MFDPVITMLQCKIHRATVTQADVHYRGSIGIDATLMEQAGLIEFQQVNVYNITTGARFETYAIREAAGSGKIQVNGAAAHLAKKGDLVIVAAYQSIPRQQALQWQPVLVYVDEKNRIIDEGRHTLSVPVKSSLKRRKTG